MGLRYINACTVTVQCTVLLRPTGKGWNIMYSKGTYKEPLLLTRYSCENDQLYWYHLVWGEPQDLSLFYVPETNIMYLTHCC